MRVHRRGGWSLGVLVAIMAFSKMMYSIPAAYLTQFSLENGVSTFEVGLIFAAFPAGALPSSILAAYLCRRVSPRVVVVGGTLLTIVATTLFSFLTHVPQRELFVVLALVLRALQGCGSAMCDTGGGVLLVSDMPRHLQQALASLEGASGLGVMLGPPIGGVLFDSLGFGGPQWVGAGACGATLLVMLFTLPNVPPTATLTHSILHGVSGFSSEFAAMTAPLHASGTRRRRGGASGGGAEPADRRRASTAASLPGAPGEAPEVATAVMEEWTSEGVLVRMLRALGGPALPTPASARAGSGLNGPSIQALPEPAAGGGGEGAAAGGGGDTEEDADEAGGTMVVHGAALRSLASDGTVVPVSSLLLLPWVDVLLVAMVSSAGAIAFLWPTLGPQMSAFGVTPGITGLFFGLVSIAYAVSTFLASQCAPKVGGTAVLGAGMLAIATAFLLLGPAVPSIPVTLELQVTALLLLGLGAGLCTSPVLGIILRLPEVQRVGSGSLETATALVSACASLGEGIGPVAAGLLVTTWHFDHACLFVTAGMAVVLVFVLCGALSRCGEDRAGAHVLFAGEETGPPAHLGMPWASSNSLLPADGGKPDASRPSRRASRTGASADTAVVALL